MTKRGAGAFSLIELLVVISIIALLASLVVPAAGTVRATTRSLKCQSNMRQIHLGILGYANDWQGMTPYINQLADRGWSPWHFDVAAIMNFTALASGTPAQRFGVFNCPENAVQNYLGDMWGPGGSGNLPELSGSYSGNGWDSVPGKPREQRYFAMPTVSFVRPGEMLAIWDGIQARVEVWYDDGLLTAPGVTKGIRSVRYKHRGSANMMYVDGHYGSSRLLPRRSESTAAYQMYYNN